MTAADIPDLAISTRETMVQALQEISQPYTGPKTSVAKTDKDATLMPPPPPPSGDSKSIGITEIRPAGQESDSSRQRTTSIVRSVASSENGSQETEEEDGHVLVRRPA
jgi:lysophosphatidate acyltransferase